MTYRRRELLRRVGVAAAGMGVLAGCTDGGSDGTDGSSDGTDGGDTAYVPTEPDYRGWFDGVSNYERTVEARERDEVRVAVGARNSNGFYAFDPPAVAVSPETTVVWEWTGRGGTHDVVAEQGAFDSGELVSREGHTFEHDFETPRAYRYFCTPHRSLGMRGAVFVSLGPRES